MSLAEQRLRLELLRTRAAIERAELASAVDDLRERTEPLLRVASAASRLGSIMGAGAGRIGSRGGWLSLALTLLDQKPWLGLLLAGTLRVARGRPLASALALGAVVVALAARRASTASAETPAEDGTAPVSTAAPPH